MNINNIHDKYMKTILGNLSLAKEFLASFLPAHVKKHIDLVLRARNKYA